MMPVEQGTILDELRTAPGQPGRLRLHLNVLPLFAQQHLPELRRKHPELHIDIGTMSRRGAAGRRIDTAIALALRPALYACRPGQGISDHVDDQRSPCPNCGRMTILLHREMRDFAEWKKAIGIPYLEPAGIDYFD